MTGLNDAGFLAWNGQVPPFHLILSLHCWLCVVCLVIGQALLHEAILSFCLDSRGTPHCRDPKLFDHSQHLSRINLVSIPISVEIIIDK